ncbi:protein SRG1-like [Solanum lycopersicum]|uniref:protein SRG1-like n=1 Tax=Solanum lycopersicum TaxID=4081 RepID=UPI0002BCC291|nr:protein SRG1-like [Solanum lycopersicum]
MDSTPEKLNFGKSLLVPSVQELAKQHLTIIPDRYLRPEQETPVISAGAEVPVIDVQKLISGDSMDSELQKLHSACQQWGFLQVINHGVTPLLLEDFKREVIELFKLPMEEKKKLWKQEDSLEGFGHAFVVSEDQKLDWSDRDIMEAYCKEIKSLATSIICQLAKALRMDEEEMRDLFNDGMQTLRMNYYPPCPEPDKAIGISPHSDADAITILFQLNETEGLQIRKDDVWVPIRPLPNALIVNIGDMMEIVSNGVYRSIEHRAIVNSNEERLSVATFCAFNLESELGPAHSLVGPCNPPIFRRVPMHKYLQDFFARKLEGKSYLDSMKVEAKDDKS